MIKILEGVKASDYYFNRKEELDFPMVVVNKAPSELGLDFSEYFCIDCYDEIHIGNMILIKPYIYTNEKEDAIAIIAKEVIFNG